tara:strand:- start:2975 stop:3094 length:120 start_codon:yes stop_codon:yes gene_type:complete
MGAMDKGKTSVCTGTASSILNKKVLYQILFKALIFSDLT